MGYRESVVMEFQISKIYVGTRILRYSRSAVTSIRYMQPSPYPEPLHCPFLSL